MKGVADAALDDMSVAQLKALQERVDRQPGFAAQVEYAKSSWKGKSAQLFNPLKEKLASMCSGNVRCCYCEDSLADEIEHMRPKDLYPEQTYVWSNYVLACGPCNGPKNNRFAVLDAAGSLVDVTRKRNSPVVPPLAGEYALVDPRVEDPLDLLWLDFQTMRYVPNTDEDQSTLFARAKYTIEVLRLNTRDALVRGRRAAVTGFESRLHNWVTQSSGWTDEKRLDFVADFRAERFRGVWERMKRHCTQLPMLSGVAQMLEVAPEAAAW